MQPPEVIRVQRMSFPGKVEAHAFDSLKKKPEGTGLGRILPHALALQVRCHQRME